MLILSKLHQIGNRATIYSLRVLLYELLTGTTPHDTKQLLAKGVGEMLRTIREDEPHKPGTRAFPRSGTPARAAMTRPTVWRQT